MSTMQARKEYVVKTVPDLMRGKTERVTIRIGPEASRVGCYCIYEGKTDLNLSDRFALVPNVIEIFNDGEWKRYPNVSVWKAEGEAQFTRVLIQKSDGHYYVMQSGMGFPDRILISHVRNLDLPVWSYDISEDHTQGL